MIEGLKPYAGYKESGSRWTGSVPSSWTVRNMRTLITHRSERNRPDLPLLSVAREKGVFVRSLTDANENHNFIPDDLTNYKVAHAGDLVINKMKAWQGSMGIAPCDGIVSPAYYVFEFRIANRAFGQALLRSKPYVAHFGQASDGVRIGQWDLSIPGMRQIPILMPREDEQDAIVRFLDHANQKISRFIRTKRRLVELLNEQKQAIIHRAMTRGIDPNVRFKTSGIDWLGDVPEHWRLRRLKYLVHNVIEQTNEKHPDDVYIALENIESWTGHLSFPSEDVKFDSQVKSFQAEDILFGKLRPYLAKVTRPKQKGVCVGELFVLRIADEGVLPEFMEQKLRSKQLIDRINSSTFGAKMPRADWTFVGNILIAYPPDNEEQKSILATINTKTVELQSAINRTRREIDLLREYRIRLISDVVTGKLDVRGVELPAMKEAETLEDIDTGEDTETEAEDVIEREEVADADE